MEFVQVKDLFGTDKVVSKSKSERGDLLSYFYEKISPTYKGKLRMSSLAFRTSHLQLPDLYYLKSKCDQEERRGEPWAKVFWGSLKPR